MALRDGTKQPSANSPAPLPWHDILVVEAGSTNRMIYGKVAKSCGEQVRVHHFMKPTQALLWLRANPAALIICDVWMAELNAFELLALLRGHPEYAAVLVVVVTGDMSDGLEERVLAAGASGFLMTPVSFHELSSRLRQLLMLSC